MCLLLIGGLPAAALGARDNWRSEVLGREVPLQWFAPASGTSRTAQPIVIYLRGLAAPRAGLEPDENILASLRAEGFGVAVIDFGGDARARWPHLNRDLAKMRAELHRGEFPAPVPVDAARIFILPAGYRLRRDVIFFEDGGRALALDIAYPSQPRAPAGAVLEFSCDNADRMGNFSLQFCADTLLDGLATEGFIVAMADHPVAAPYQGIDPMPDVAFIAKAAVRTLRANLADLGGNGRIASLGFSRGSGMALLLATTEERTEFDGRGAHREVSSAVQGAVVLSGRFTYLDLRADDKMIPRYEAAWGPRSENEATWRTHGALDHLVQPTMPLFLSINVAESRDALHQMDVLRRRLTELKSPFEYHPESEPRGHRMPLDEGVLSAMLAYLNRQLNPAAPGQAALEPNHD